MKISSLYRRDVVSCTIHDTLARAAQLMWDRDLGCLPVIDDQGHVAGMITDRDICMAAYLQGTNLSAIRVASVMAKRVVSCLDSDEVEAVERVMREHQIRRLPVIDEHGHPIGIVSLNDIARVASAGKVAAKEVTSTLAAVSAPRAIAASAA